MKKLQSIFAPWYTIVALFLANVYFAIFLFPDQHKQIRAIAKNPNYKTLDVSFGYDKAYVIQLFEDLTENGKYLYSKIELGIDMVFPILYPCLLIRLILALSKNLENSKIQYLALIPIFTTICDFTENLLIVSLLQTPIDLISDTIVLFASTATIGKLSSLYLCILIIVVLAILQTIKKLGFSRQ